MNALRFAGLVWVAAGLAACSAPPPDDTADSGVNDAGFPDGALPPGCKCPTGPATSVHLALACLCEGSSWGAFLCSRSVADLSADATCTDGKSAYRNIGCGKIAYEPGRDYGGNVLTYRMPPAFPIGVFQFGPAPFGPCAANGVTGYVYGEALLAQGHPAAAPGDECGSIAGCKLCGPATDPTAMCM